MKTFLISALVLSFIITCLTGLCPVLCKKSGLAGYLSAVSGNQMPSPGVARPGPKGIKGTFYIYELTKFSQATRRGNSSFFTAVSTRLIKEVETKNNGYFKVNLPPGRYSIFLKTDQGMYSNLSDGDNNIGPVEVRPKKMTRLELKMDHHAFY